MTTKVRINHTYGHSHPSDSGRTVQVEGEIVAKILFHVNGIIREVPVVRFPLPADERVYVIRGSKKFWKTHSREVAFELVEKDVRSFALVESDRKLWESHLIFTPAEDLGQEVL